MGEKNRLVLKYDLWVRLGLILGVFFWIAIIVLAYIESNNNMGSAWMILLILFSFTLGPAINVNMTWFSYDGQGVEWHNPLRKPVYIRWDEVLVIRRISHGWRIEGPGREIQIPGNLNGVNDLAQEVKKMVPREKWVNY